MADEKLTALVEMTAPELTDLAYSVDDPAGVPTSQKIELGRLLALLALGTVQGRLTLATGTPVTTSDVLAATTLYFTPYNGNRISLYDGAAWALYSFAELSIAVPATTNTNYDVFVYDNAGVLTLELTAWANDTTRATALATQDGVYIRSGATTRRYLGTFRTTGSNGQTEDSKANRFLWNHYNRASRQMVVIDTTNSWTYAIPAWRAANGSNANRVNFVIGIAENPVVAVVQVRQILTGSPVTRSGAVGIGLDSVVVNSANLLTDVNTTAAITIASINLAHYIGIPGIGFHFLQWIEYARLNTITWYGDSGFPNQQSGLLALTEG